MANEPPTINNIKNGYSSKPCSKDIRAAAKLLGHDIVHYVSNNNRYVTSSSVQNEKLLPVTKTLRRTVDELSQRHEILFRGMVKKLEISPENVNQVFFNIADEIFKDKQYNWGRIVSVYAFGGRLAKHLSDNHLTTDIDFIGEFIGHYVSENLGWWIESKGGWVS